MHYFKRMKKNIWHTLSVVCFVMVIFIINACQSLPNIHPELLNVLENEYPSTLVIDNVNLLSMTNEASPITYNQQLVISNTETESVITKILPAGSAYDNNAEYIDAKQAFITPGLMDMHVHFMDRQALMLSLSYGVTTVRALRGRKHHLQWKQELQKKQWLGSNLVVSTPVLDQKDTHLLNMAIESSEHVAKMVHSLKAQGYDLIKVYGSLPHTEYSMLYKTANKLNFPIAKHGPHPPEGGTWGALSGLQSLEHVEDIFQGPLNYTFDYQKLAAVVTKIKSLDVAVTPTLAVFSHLARLSNEKEAFINTINLAFINPFQKNIATKYPVARWLADSSEESLYHYKKFSFLKEIVTELHAQKVPLLVGSDAGVMYTLQGKSTHLEMALLHESGLSKYQTILAATVNPAKALKQFEKYGSIEVGKFADLLMSESNPLDDLATLKAPIAVIKSGQYLSKKKLALLKKDAQVHPNYWFTLFTLVEDKISEFLL